MRTVIYSCLIGMSLGVQLWKLIAGDPLLAQVAVGQTPGDVKPKDQRCV